MSRQIVQNNLLNAVSSVSHSEPILVSDFRHKDVVFSTAGMGAGDTITVRVKGAFTESKPDFTAAQSSANEWTYVQVVDLEDGVAEDGSLGITFAEADGVRAFSINADGVRWVCIEVAVISDANSSVTANISLYN